MRSKLIVAFCSTATNQNGRFCKKSLEAAGIEPATSQSWADQANHLSWTSEISSLSHLLGVDANPSGHCSEFGSQTGFNFLNFEFLMQKLKLFESKKLNSSF